MIKLVDSFEDENYLGIVYEYCDQGTLSDMMKKSVSKNFIEKEALNYFL